MQTFTDKNGDLWHIELNVGSAKRVKAECGIDLIDTLQIADEKISSTIFEKLSGDIELFVNVLFSLCRKQAMDQNIDAEKFAELFTGDIIESASNALVEEIINFSPPIRRKALNHFYQMSKTLMGEMEGEMESLLKEMDLQSEIKKQLGKLSTDMLESAE
jgi:hypothetical protein